MMQLQNGLEVEYMATLLDLKIALNGLMDHCGKLSVCISSYDMFWLWLCYVYDIVFVVEKIECVLSVELEIKERWCHQLLGREK